jgi:hypothetical protein
MFTVRWPWFVLWIPVLATLPWRVAGFNAVIHPGQGSSVPSWILQAGFARTIVYLVAGIVVLALSYRRLLDGNEKRRVRVLMAGTAVSTVSAIGLVWFDSFYGRSLRLQGVLFLGILVPFNTACFFSLAYAILRHRVMEIRVIVRQGLQYAFARNFVLGLIPAFGVLLVVDLAMNSQEPLAQIMRNRGWIYAGLGGGAFAIHWKRKQWLNAIDRRFFRERYDAHRVLSQVVEEIRAARKLERVASRVVTQIEKALHAEFVSLMIREPDRSEYLTLAVVPSTAVAGVPATLGANSKLIGLARVLGKPLEVLTAESEWLERRVPRAEIDFLRQKRIDLIVPIVGTPESRDALLILGIKRSEEPYTREDQQLLEAIAASLALLLEPQVTTDSQRAPVFHECPQCGMCYDSTFSTCRHEGANLLPVQLPQTLAGRYRLERRRGRGGMGIVYEALDASLGRRVAIKVIRDHLFGSVEAAERFQREARASALFSHPNVVTVHDYGVESSRAFLVMELLEGMTLREELNRRGRLEGRRIVAIFRDVCSAIEAAHRRQLIHRDVKPENIFLTSGPVKVLDFGVAKFLPDLSEDAVTRATQTRTGMIVGTLPYMSPEQLLGENADVMWDLWALAVVAYETLTGVLPFQNVSPAEWRQLLLAGNFTPLNAHIPNPREEWTTFFRRSFAPDRTLRPQSAVELLRSLELASHE